MDIFRNEMKTTPMKLEIDTTHQNSFQKMKTLGTPTIQDKEGQISPKADPQTRVIEEWIPQFEPLLYQISEQSPSQKSFSYTLFFQLRIYCQQKYSKVIIALPQHFLAKKIMAKIKYGKSSRIKRIKFIFKNTRKKNEFKIKKRKLELKHESCIITKRCTKNNNANRVQ
jgi:hypothetical protein